MNRVRGGAAAAVGVVVGALLAAAAMPSYGSDHPVPTGSTSRATSRAAAGGAVVEASQSTDVAASVERLASAAVAAAGDASRGKGAPVEGVTDTTIRIGVGLPDLGVVGALGPGYDDGDVKAQMAAVLAHLHESGRLPVNGRDVVFVYRTYDTTSPEAQRAACLGWALDDHVFAVFAIHSFWSAGECVAGEHHIPLLVSDTYDDGQLGRAPLLFTLPLSESTNHRNWVHWAAAHGVIDQRSRIGLYYSSVPDEAWSTDHALLPEMKAMGFADQIVDVVRTDEIATGSPQDDVAAQRFAAKRVDVAWLMVGPINQTNFMQVAESLRYKPKYVASDWLFLTNDTATATYPASQYEGTLAITTLHFGESGAGIAPPAQAQACADNYATHGGPKVDPGTRPAEWTALITGCDLAEVMMTALERSGRDLTRAALASSLESYTGQLGLYADVRFGPGKHGGTSTQRTLRWFSSCTCWKAEGSFSALYVE